jgi:D-alanine-D-alanine ligase
MRVAVVHNSKTSGSDVINVFGLQNREKYNPKTVELVASSLEKGGHNVRVLDGNMHLVEQLHDFMPRVLSGERPGIVFNMAYGIQGVSRYTHIPAMLEMLGVPYVGSAPTGHGIALDKVIAKMLFQSQGLPTPGFWNFASDEDQFDDLTFPVIVKPKMEAVSYGIEVVHDDNSLRRAVNHIIAEFGQHVLVEAFIPGREFAVGLLGNSPPEVLPIVEIDLEGDPSGIQTAEDKLGAPRGKLCPAPLDDDKAHELRQLAQRAFTSLDLRDFARVDFRMDAEGNPYILEINSMASLGLAGSYVTAAREAGYTYDTLVNRMLDVAAERYFGGADTTADNDRVQPLGTRVRSCLRSQSTTTEDLLQRLVDHHSPADDVEQVNATGDLVAAQLRRLGFEAQVFPQATAGNVLLFRNHSGDHDDVLVLGHLDTAPGVEFRRFRAEGARLYGTGVAESKGGLAVLVAALRALRHARALRRVRCAILLTTDDTVGGGAARSVIEECSQKAGRVLGLKSADLDGAIITTRSGRSTYRVRGSFEGALKAGRPERAAAEFTRRTLGIQSLSDPDEGVRVAVLHLLVDAPFEQFPDKAEATVSVRFNRAELGQEIDDKINRTLSRTSRGVRFRVSGGERRPAMPATEVSMQLAEEISEVARRANIPISTAHRWSSADICFVPDEIPAVDGLGPLGERERSVDEFVLRGSLVDRAALLAMVIAESRS